MNNANNILPTCEFDMKAKGDSLPWYQYPGGIRVTVALVNDNKHLLLRRDTRYTYSLPWVGLGREQALSEMPNKLAQQLDADGISVSFERSDVKIVGAVGIKGELHILMLGTIAGVRSAAKHDFVGDALMLGGLSVSNPIHLYMPSVLGWADADYFTERLAA